MKIVVVMIAVMGVGIATAQAAPKGRNPVVNRVGSAPTIGAEGNIKAMLGAADFHPSTERPVGWRGDWMGKFPGATPPVTWGRMVKSPVKDLRSSAAKPAKPDDGVAIPDGIVQELLFAGPFSCASLDEGAEKEFIDDPKTVEPVPGGEAGSSKWELRKEEGVNAGYSRGGVIYHEPYRDPVIGEKARPNENRVYYYHVYLQSKGGKVSLRQDANTDGGITMWLNGAQILSYKVDPANSKSMKWQAHQVSVDLKSGWNRLLIKQWFFDSGRKRVGFRFWPEGKSDTYQYETRNVAWQIPMPHASVAAPIVVGNKVIVLSEPYTLICMNRETGKVEWLGESTYFDCLGDDEKKQMQAKVPSISAQVEKIASLNSKLLDEMNSGKVITATKERDSAINELHKSMQGVDKPRFTPGGSDGGSAVFTPCSDGKNICVFFPTGVAACYDLNGNLKWAKLNEIHDETHHGFASSPLMKDGKFIVYYRAITAYDVETGKKAWRDLQEGLDEKKYTGLEDANRERFKGTLFWSSLVPIKAAGGNAVYLSHGSAMRISDGKVLLSSTQFGSHICPTPVTEGDFVYNGGSVGDKVFEMKFSQDEADKTILTLTRKIESGGGDMYCVASPLIHNGLCYVVGSYKGQLCVIDIAAGKPLYSQFLDLRAISKYSQSGGVDASPVLGGKYVYVIDNRGTTVVLEPGPQYKPVARNALQDFRNDVEQDETHSNPVFAGNDMFIRSQRYTYCIREM